MNSDLLSLIPSLPTLSQERKDALTSALQKGAPTSEQKEELTQALLESILILEDERDTALELLKAV